MITIDDFIADAVQAYITCALWATTDWSDAESGGYPLDRKYGADNLTIEAVAKIEDDVTAFITANWDDVKGLDPAGVGHDFLLTRDHHGAGFWDRGLGALGDRLTAASHPYGESGFYVTDDGSIDVQ